MPDIDSKATLLPCATVVDSASQSLASFLAVKLGVSSAVLPLTLIVVVSNRNECLYSVLTGGLCLKIRAASARCLVPLLRGASQRGIVSGPPVVPVPTEGPLPEESWSG